jgi:hypothetical protein
MSVCVCVCVRERGYVCVCVRERVCACACVYIARCAWERGGEGCVEVWVSECVRFIVYEYPHTHTHTHRPLKPRPCAPLWTRR